MNTKVITAHVPLPLAEKVDQIAARLDRSRGWVVKQALTDWLENKEDRRRLTLEALADIDVGHVISLRERLRVGVLCSERLHCHVLRKTQETPETA